LVVTVLYVPDSLDLKPIADFADDFWAKVRPTPGDRLEVANLAVTGLYVAVTGLYVAVTGL